MRLLKILLPWRQWIKIELYSLYFLFMQFSNTKFYTYGQFFSRAIVSVVFLLLVDFIYYRLYKDVHMQLWRNLFFVLVGLYISLALLGYLFFHGFDNIISANLWNKEVPATWILYLKNFSHFFLQAAKYSLILFLCKVIIRLLEERFLYNAVSSAKNGLARHFSSNLIGKVFNWLELGGPIPASQISSVDELLTYSLDTYGCENIRMVPLSVEQRYVYELAEVRGANILIVFPENACDIPIPALLLASLFKNMCKHGEVTSGDKLALFKVTYTKKQLSILIENEKSQAGKWCRGFSEGEGIKGIREILNAVYGENATMTIFSTETTYRLELEIITN
ncbi:hypothetical protein [Sphingobacterium sp. LRF_L2]|uniref:hypothetical protein n=1 Tax=Sphingobacterium sp. LRF_L2 TaxID=3369421 RepID=UPI003F6345F8